MLLIKDNTVIHEDDLALIDRLRKSTLDFFTPNKQTVLRIMHASKMRKSKGIKFFEIPDTEIVNGMPSEAMMKVLDNLVGGELLPATNRPIQVFPNVTPTNLVVGDWKTNLKADEIELLHTRYGLPMYHGTPVFDEIRNINTPITSFYIEDGQAYNLGNLQDACEVAVLRASGFVFTDDESIPNDVAPAFVWHNEEANQTKEAKLQIRIATITQKLLQATPSVQSDILEYAMLKYPVIKSEIGISTLPSLDAISSVAMYCTRLLAIKNTIVKPGWDIVAEAAVLREQKQLADTLVMYRLLERSIWEMREDNGVVYLRTTGIGNFASNTQLGTWEDVLSKMQTPEFAIYRSYGERIAKAAIATYGEIQKTTSDHAFFKQITLAAEDEKELDFSFAAENGDSDDDKLENVNLQGSNQSSGYHQACRIFAEICQSVGWVKPTLFGLPKNTMINIIDRLKGYPNVEEFKKLIDLPYAEFQKQAGKLLKED